MKPAEYAAPVPTTTAATSHGISLQPISSLLLRGALQSLSLHCTADLAFRPTATTALKHVAHNRLVYLASANQRSSGLSIVCEQAIEEDFVLLEVSPLNWDRRSEIDRFIGPLTPNESRLHGTAVHPNPGP